MVADGDDSIVFLINDTGLLGLSQRGADVSIGAGEALGVLHAEPSTLTTSRVDYVAFGIPRAAPAPMVADIEDAAMRLIPRNNEALTLLSRYVGLLRQDPTPVSSELRYAVVTHTHDLIAMALGATRDGAEIAKARGMQAARLRPIKADIIESLGNPDLSVTAVAQRQRVTPR